MKRSGAEVMGSLEWGRATSGRLKNREACRLVGNLVLLQMREGFDAMRSKLGLLRPADISLDDLAPPESRLAKDSLGHAQETHSIPLLYHSWRTYYFGALIAAHDKIKFDRELLFSSAILHDMGLTRSNSVPLNKCCFAVSGAILACDHLRSRGHDATKVEAVGDAISLHLNMHVSQRRHGAEAFLVARGAVCDLFGPGHRRISVRSADEVHRVYPRDGVVEALQFETAEHVPGGRPSVLERIMGKKAPPSPFERSGHQVESSS